MVSPIQSLTGINYHNRFTVSHAQFSLLTSPNAWRTVVVLTDSARSINASSGYSTLAWQPEALGGCGVDCGGLTRAGRSSRLGRGGQALAKQGAQVFKLRAGGQNNDVSLNHPWWTLSQLSGDLSGPRICQYCGLAAAAEKRANDNSSSFPRFPHFPCPHLLAISVNLSSLEGSKS